MILYLLQSGRTILALLLVLAILPVDLANAYFSTVESTSGTVAASELEVSLEMSAETSWLGATNLTSTSTITIEHSDASVARDSMLVASTTGNGAFCTALTIAIDDGMGNSTTKPVDDLLFGPLLDVDTLAILDVAFELENSVIGDIPHGAGCSVHLTVHSAQRGLTSASGFTDRQSATWNLIASQIVLNEVLPDPADGQQEFIELYNNGSEPVDVAGWTITERSGSGAIVPHTIVSTPELSADLLALDDSGSTIVPPGGFLALKFAGNVQYLNNDGDKITLLDQGGARLDEYEYESSLDGKSDARIPDGTGAWIDPIPTPGAPNIQEVVGETITSTESLVQMNTVVDPTNQSTTGTPKSASNSEIETPADQSATVSAEQDSAVSGTPIEESATKTREVVEPVEIVPEPVSTDADLEPVDKPEPTPEPPGEQGSTEVPPQSESLPESEETVESKSEPAEPEQPEDTPPTPNDPPVGQKPEAIETETIKSEEEITI